MAVSTFIICHGPSEKNVAEGERKKILKFVVQENFISMEK
jgi:hypothetical protein